MADYFAAEPEALRFFANPGNANTYVNSLYDISKKASDDQAMTAAGQQYGAGNYAGSAVTLANSGNIPAAAQVQQQGQAANSAGMQYLTKALPIFQKAAQLHAQEGPEAQKQALVGLFDHIAQEAQHLTGISDQTLAAVRQSLASDPQGTLQRLQDMVPTEFKQAGNTIVPVQGNQILTDQAYTAPGYHDVPPGGTLVQTGGAASSPAQAPPGAATPQQPPVQSGTDNQSANGLLADPHAVASIESHNNPLAVSEAGAVGTMQTLPSTLHDPGYGVTPAQDGSAQEQTRVGTDYLGALGNKFGNVVPQLVAYKDGPGFAQKWLSAGGHWDQLKKDTQIYLGRYMVASMMGRQPPPMPQQSAPQGGAPQTQPQAQGGARVVYQGQPAFTPIGKADPSLRAAYPGAIGIEASGKPMYPPANASTVADSSLGTPDTQSNSILAATGLPYEAFLTLTGQASKLPRDKTTRSVAFKTATDFANKRGIDVSSFSSQYDAYNKVLQNNIERYNQTRIMEGELQGTIGNLKPVADAVGMGKIRLVNVLQAAAGKEVNDPTVMQYSFQLQQLRAELAGYNGALQGRTGNNITEQDMREADNVIKNGLNSGGAGGLAQAVSAATGKMSGVLQNNIRLTNRAIWGLFGVGGQFDRKHPAPKPPQQAQPQRQGGQPSPQDIVNELRRRGVVK